MYWPNSSVVLTQHTFMKCSCSILGSGYTRRDATCGRFAIFLHLTKSPLSMWFLCIFLLSKWINYQSGAFLRMAILMCSLHAVLDTRYILTCNLTPNMAYHGWKIVMWRQLKTPIINVKLHSKLERAVCNNQKHKMITSSWICFSSEDVQTCIFLVLYWKLFYFIKRPSFVPLIQMAEQAARSFFITSDSVCLLAKMDYAQNDNIWFQTYLVINYKWFCGVSLSYGCRCAWIRHHLHKQRLVQMSSNLEGLVFWKNRVNLCDWVMGLFVSAVCF